MMNDERHGDDVCCIVAVDVDEVSWLPVCRFFAFSLRL